MDPTSVFRSRVLKGKLLAALQTEREERGEDAISGNVMNAADLREAFSAMGDEVPSKDLFPLVQAADPDGDGVVTLQSFLEVVQIRRTQLETIRAQQLLVEAYVSLGGDADRDAKVKSGILSAVASDFVGAGATERGLAAVRKHKMKAVQEVLDMGGALDSDEEEELKDTSKLGFDELEAFAAALAEGGADVPDDAEEEGASPSPSEAEGKKTRRSSKDLLG